MVLNTCLFLAGLVWIASVIVGSPMLFVQQLKVSALQKTHKIAFFSLKKALNSLTAEPQMLWIDAF